MPKTPRERQIERALKLEAAVATIRERGMSAEVVTGTVRAALDAAMVRAGITGVEADEARMNQRMMLKLCIEASVLSHDALTYQGIPVQIDSSIPDGVVAIKHKAKAGAWMRSLRDFNTISARFNTITGLSA